MGVFLFEPAVIHPAEGVVFGIHPLPGDVLVLLFQHLVGIFIGGIQHLDFHVDIQKALAGELGSHYLVQLLGCTLQALGLGSEVAGAIGTSSPSIRQGWSVPRSRLLTSGVFFLPFISICDISIFVISVYVIIYACNK